jgi:putative Mg2+ transporter-C (MgtC) family protein
VDRDQVTGLTTAASIWMTAAIGVAAGIGSIWFSLIATAIAWIILDIVDRFGRRPADGEHG